jgi:hypothetical protein
LIRKSPENVNGCGRLCAAGPPIPPIKTALRPECQERSAIWSRPSGGSVAAGHKGSDLGSDLAGGRKESSSVPRGLLSPTSHQPAAAHRRASYLLIRTCPQRIKRPTRFIRHWDRMPSGGPTRAALIGSGTGTEHLQRRRRRCEPTNLLPLEPAGEAPAIHAASRGPRRSVTGRSAELVRQPCDGEAIPPPSGMRRRQGMIESKA